MGLRTKLLTTFIGIILCLLGFTQYISLTRTSEFQTERINAQLRLTESRFNQKFENERAFNEKLVSTITSDQKYRSFLQQIRDNFYIFAEEIAADTQANIVFIIDEELSVRGVNAAPDNVDVDDYMQEIEDLAESDEIADILEEILDNGEAISRVVALDGTLLNTANVPLKESLRDDYALGVVTVGVIIDDEWVLNFLGEEISGVDIVFYSADAPVASNISDQRRQRVLKAANEATQSADNSFLINEERFIMVRGSFESAGQPAGYIFASSLDAAMKPFLSLQNTIIMIGLAALAMGLLVVLVLTNRIVFPVRLLVQGTNEVVAGNYDFKVENNSKDEIGVLSRAFNKMTEGLREKEQIKNLFGKYVNPAIVADIMQDPDNLQLGGTRKVQTLLFSDIEGFTTISEGMNAEQLVGFLNEYLGAMSDEISSANGILDKYLGDGIMAFWGPPFNKDNHAFGACLAALGMQGKLVELCADWSTRDLPSIRVRIGIATGDVIVGNIGSEQAQDYTCIGDTVNLSSRLEGVNKYYGTSIIIDEKTLAMVEGQVVVRELDTVQVKGRTSGTRIFELIGLSDDLVDEVMIERYGVALAFFRAGDFMNAEKEFAGLVDNHEDIASLKMAERCRNYMENPPENWNGIQEMTDK
jgi:class 3 adenylate cyclase/sensor domain CHASE-containing protein